MAMYEEYVDEPRIKPKGWEKKRMHKLFRKAGRQKLDDAPKKYVGTKGWFW